MAEIRVTPAQLREAADTLEAGAQKIGEGVETVSSTINAVIHREHLKGQRASELYARFQRIRPEMQTWSQYLTEFASQLRAAAERFEQADQAQQAGGGTVLGAASENDYVRLPDGTILEIPPDPNEARTLDQLSVEELERLLEAEKAKLDQYGKAYVGSVAKMATDGMGGATDLITLDVKDLVFSGGKLFLGSYADAMAIDDPRARFLAQREMVKVIGATLYEKEMHPDFTVGELDGMKARYEEIRASYQQTINDFLTMNPGEFILNKISGTYDTYADLSRDAWHKIQEIDAHLLAIEMRRAKLEQTP